MRHPSGLGPLYGWTFHQSHDQATVLFLVPHSISAADIDIRIASDHVSATIQSHPPILQARLFGRVNTDSSTWRIADRDRTRKRRSRSFARSSATPPSNSASGSADTSYARPDHAHPRQRQSTVPSVATSASSRASGSHVHLESPQPSSSSLSASIISVNSGSSYEVLSNSTPPSLPTHSAGPATEWSSGSSDLGSSDSADASLTQSVVLSDPGDQRRYATPSVPSTEQDTHPNVRRSHSISNLAEVPSSASTAAQHNFGSPAIAPTSGPPEVRLVTVHLDKIDTGIWPLLVIGPAPLQIDSVPARLMRLLASDLSRNEAITETFISDRILRRRRLEQEHQQRSAAQLQLNQALEEALSAFEDGDRVLAAIRRATPSSASSQSTSNSHAQDLSRISIDSDEDLGPNTSTLSINTIASDESATVLGSRAASRVASLAATSAGLERAHAAASESSQTDALTDQDDDVLEAWKELEVLARYNMDPTTLSLIGLQHANSDSVHRSSSLADQLRRTSSSSSSGIPDAFEYFARAWRAADVSLATERLVQDFLPLLPSTAGHPDQSALQARLSEILEPFLARSALNLPATAEMMPTSLRDRLHSHSYMSHRQRLVASLGGPKALARLYVSYARLHLPSLASNRSPLAFPYGQLTSPFVSGGQGAPHPTSNVRRRFSPNPTTTTSSRTPSIASLTFAAAEGGAASPSKSTRAPNSPTVAESSRVASPDHAAGPGDANQLDFSDFVVQADPAASQPGAFYFFREACMLDHDVAAQISTDEWSEAVVLALQAEERRADEEDGLRQAEEMGSLAGISESGCLTFESDDEMPTSAPPRSHRSRATSTSALSGLFNLGWMGDETGQRSQRNARLRSSKGRRRRKQRRAAAKLDGTDAGMLNFVSGAALLGVALAGSVAALGWWRRTSAAINPSA